MSDMEGPHEQHSSGNVRELIPQLFAPIRPLRKETVLLPFCTLVGMKKGPRLAETQDLVPSPMTRNGE